jgi:4-hydroxy-4-methyl-2-oxoglutarate aldolase
MTSTNDSGLTSRASAIPTTVLSDLLADAGHPGQVLTTGIQAFDPSTTRVAGWAYTVAGDAARTDESGPDAIKAGAIDAMPADAFAVWSSGGVEGVCLFGDLLAAGMAARGVVGAVVDGGVRDIDDIARIPFPVFARYRTPKASSGIWRVREVQVPVDIAGTRGAGVKVHPGDLVVADANGVVSIPRSLALDIVVAGEAYLVRETTIRQRIDRGDSLKALVAEFGRL